MATDLLPATEKEQAHFFVQLQEGFRAASGRTGEIVRDFRVAGTSVRLRFAGEALIPAIVPGLAYPMSGLDSEPRCEICLWDSESCGVQLAPPPRPWKDFTERGNIWGFDSSRYRSAYHWGEGSVNVMDREARQAVFWVPTHKHLPAWVLAAPLRSILHWWMELNGRQLVHAAAVGCHGRGVLIPGRGGSGKSSTAMACLLAGMDFIADDYLAVAMEPEPRAYRLYTTAKLDSHSLKLYPDLAARCRAIHQPGFGKVVLFLEEGYREQLKESLLLNLVLKPWISAVPETMVGPTEPPEIERALASETLAHLPHAGVRTVEFLNRVSHEIPGAAIYLGMDRARIPAAIQKAIDAPITADLPRRRAGERRPFISVVVHFQREERGELRALAADIEAQGYPRTEFIVMASGPACAMRDEVSNLSGNMRFFQFENAVVKAEAWNRGVRESFAELLALIEPGDRFPLGALDALGSACELDSGAAWVQGQAVCSADGNESLGPLRGALIRKSTFRACGLFPTDRFLQGREHRKWLTRAEEKGLAGRQIEAVTLHATPAAAIQPSGLLLKPDLRFLRELARGRREELK
jgi:hypothetical protein